MKSVIDTSTLISLARIGPLEIIPRLKIDVVLPDDVYEEANKTVEDFRFLA